MDKEYKAALLRAAITIIVCIVISLVPDPIPVIDELIIMLFGGRSAMNAFVAAEAIKVATKGKVNVDKETINRVAQGSTQGDISKNMSMDIFSYKDGDGRNGEQRS